MLIRPIALAAASVALALGLSGCFSNPVESLVEGVIENQTGIDVDTSTDGGSVALPDGWPGQPVPEGRITSSFAVDSTFSLTILVETEEEIERVIAELIASGYAEAARADYGDLNSVVLSSSEWGATFGWVPDEESGMFLLNYSVTATN